MRRMCHAPLLGAFLLVSCTHAQLVAAGDAMVRAERGVSVTVDGVVDYKDIVKEDCVAQNLQTEAERAKCVEKALAVVRASQTGVKGVRAGLVTFWELYALLEGKHQRGEKVSPTDLAELAAVASRVISEYEALVKAIKEAKQP